MKSINLFCASPASTATICSSMEQRLIVRPVVDRQKNKTNNAAGPCSSHLPFDPSTRPPFKHNSTRKSNNNNNNTSAAKQQTEISRRRKSSGNVDHHDLASSTSRYLLSDHPANFFDADVSSSDYCSRGQPLTKKDDDNEYPVYKPSPTTGLKLNISAHHNSSSTPTNNRQVVELRVSIHCKGCEGKLRKYISRMEGVTSFSIDMATKKVTVIGDVSPLDVLRSISQVKNAQFWPSPTTLSSSPTPRLIY